MSLNLSLTERTELGKQIEEFVNLLEEDVKSDGIIPHEYIQYLDSNFSNEFITLVLNAVGLLKLKKREFNAAKHIFEYTIEKYDKENPFLYTSIAITYLESIPEKPKLDDVNKNKVFAAKKYIDLAKKYIKEEPHSDAKKNYSLIIERYLGYFNISLKSIFQEIDRIDNKVIQLGIINSNTSKADMSNNNNFYGNVKNSQFGDGNTQHNVDNSSVVNEQSLPKEVEREIQKLIKQLEANNPTATDDEKVAYINDKMNPTLKSRVVNALKASSETTIDEFLLENKYLKVAKAAIKGWLK